MKQVIIVFLITLLSVKTFSQIFGINSYDDARQYLSSLGIPYEKNLFNLGPFDDEYDFIVIGAGAGGAPVANRLSENLEWNVLILEAGPEESEIFKIPAFDTFVYKTPVDWDYKTEPQDYACLGFPTRRCMWPRGKNLGGTTSINGMVYGRGQRNDYDNWAKMGNTGWSYEEVLPYFLKSEKASYKLLMDKSTSPYHSRLGNLAVQHVPYRFKLGKAFLKAQKELNFTLTDPSNGDVMPGTYAQPQVMEEHGLRCSASRAYLEHARFRPNLHVAINSFVTKILIDPVTKVATGVVVSKNFQTYLIRARKEVVVSAGALNSPQLLMLSGVGPKDHLEELGIPVIQDLPVGQNLRDHVGFSGLVFTVNETGVSATPLKLLNLTALLDLYAEGNGVFTTIYSECISFISTKYNTEYGLDSEVLFVSASYLPLPARAARMSEFGVSDEIYNAVYKPYANAEAWTVVPINFSPKSVGYMKLKSSNPFDHPLFYPNYLKEEEDVERLLEGIKYVIAVSQTAAMQKYGSKLIDTKIPACAAFEFGSDDYWRCAARQVTFVMHHQSGTCKMGPEGDPTAVVSPELKVHGIKNLRVIDSSIFPRLIRGHVTPAIIMVGEKGADLIKSSWANEPLFFK